MRWLEWRSIGDCCPRNGLHVETRLAASPCLCLPGAQEEDTTRRVAKDHVDEDAKPRRSNGWQQTARPHIPYSPAGDTDSRMPPSSDPLRSPTPRAIGRGAYRRTQTLP